MAGPGQALKPTEEAIVKPVFQSELANIQQKYGLDLSRTETNLIVTRAMAGTRATTPPEARERLENELITYLKASDPVKAAGFSAQLEARKYDELNRRQGKVHWEVLGLDQRNIMTLGGALDIWGGENAAVAELKKSTVTFQTVGQALDVFRGTEQDSKELMETVVKFHGRSVSLASAYWQNIKNAKAMKELEKQKITFKDQEMSVGTALERYYQPAEALGKLMNTTISFGGKMMSVEAAMELCDRERDPGLTSDFNNTKISFTTTVETALSAAERKPATLETVSGLYVSFRPLGDALEKCRKETNLAIKERLYAGIACEVAEQYRIVPRPKLQAEIEAEQKAIKAGKEIEPSRNALGIAYDKNASDPADVLSKKTFNCFSGSISLGQMLSYVADRVELGNVVPVLPQVQLVSSWSTGSRWDDKGHAILRLDVGLGSERKTIYMDPMNEFTRSAPKAFALDTEKSVITRPPSSSGMLASYRPGDTVAITPGLIKTAGIQDRLLDKKTASTVTLAEVASMPPAFAIYGVANLEPEAQRTLFQKYNIANVTNLSQKYQLASMAAVAFSETDPVKAQGYGKMALTALARVTSASMENTVQLPMAGSIGTTANLVSMMQKTDEGKALLALSKMWLYLPIMINDAPEGVLNNAEWGDLAKAQQFLSWFYSTHPKALAGERSNPPNLIRGANAMLKLADQTGEVPSQAAMDSIYAALGLNRKATLATLRRNAMETDGVSAKKIASFLESPSFLRAFDRSVIGVAAYGYVPPSREDIGQAIEKNQKPPQYINRIKDNLDGFCMSTDSSGEMSRVLSNAMDKTFRNPAVLAGLMLESGPLVQAFREARLLGTRPVYQKAVQK